MKMNLDAPNGMRDFSRVSVMTVWAGCMDDRRQMSQRCRWEQGLILNGHEHWHIGQSTSRNRP
jgi:hypothetical protein